MERLERNAALDIFKGLLVYGMVLAHVIQLTSFTDLGSDLSLGITSTIVNLVSFSGYLFAFGYANYFAYFRRDFGSVWPRMLMTALKTLMAFYICGIAFRALLDDQVLIGRLVTAVTTLQVIPGYSEFLIAFAFLSFLALILFVPLQRLTQNPNALLGGGVALLFTTFIPLPANIPNWLSPLIGSSSIPSFPVMQYFFWYALGMWFAVTGQRIDWKVLAIAAVLTVFMMVSSRSGLPSRFPPSLAWIVGPSLLLAMYFLLAQYLVRWRRWVKGLEIAGRNVLFFLVMSNLLIFVLHSERVTLGTPLGLAVVGTALLLGTITYLLSIVRN